MGYTTGSCAAAAAKAATIMLFRQKKLNSIELMTPKGILLKLDVLDININNDFVCCAIKKDSGDDPDVTNGMLVYAKVSFNNSDDIFIDGGEGVGRVTKAGLEQSIGSAAINRVPREMIYNEVKEICDGYEYEKGIDVLISVPGGEEIAKKTFNPKLGIEGGISILGTSGIIEPMSEVALVDSIKVEMKQLAHNGLEYLVVTPGNYGSRFIEENINIDIENSLKCSNYVGETIDYAVELGLKGILFISHIGKFIKVAGGVMNTHSKWADTRMEIIAANAAVAGVGNQVLTKIMGCTTTDEAIDLLIKDNNLDNTMKLIGEKIDYYLKNRCFNELEIGAIVFSNRHGILVKTKDVEKILNKVIID